MTENSTYQEWVAFWGARVIGGEYTAEAALDTAHDLVIEKGYELLKVEYK
jgi:hypothetical protein